MHAGFKSSTVQQWEVTHTGDGYYTIRSMQLMEGGYLGYEDNSTNENETFSRANDQFSDTRWAITKNTEGKYEISPKNKPDHMMQIIPKNTGIIQIVPDNEASAYRWILVDTTHVLPVLYVAQEEKGWCWIASALMFVKHYFPDFGGVTRITQYNCAYYYFLRDQDYEGTVDDMPGSPKEAIDYYFNTEGYALPTIYLNGKIYEEKTIMQFIDDGHVLIINHRRYEKNGDIYQFNPDEPGHMYVLTGYVLINGNIWFVLLDPDTGLDGRTALLVTYDELCCSHETRNDPWFFWYATLVVDTEYANKTLPWKFPE